MTIYFFVCRESPKEISPAVKAKRKRPFAQEPQPKKNQKTIPKTLQENPTPVEGKGPSNLFQLFTNSANRQNDNDKKTANNAANESKKSYMDFIHTPPDQNHQGRKRQRLTPTPVHNYLCSSSPAAFLTPSERPPLKARSRTNLKVTV